MKKLGHKDHYRRVTVNIRIDLYNTLKEMAKSENKSLALLINEILEKALKRKVQSVSSKG